MRCVCESTSDWCVLVPCPLSAGRSSPGFLWWTTASPAPVTSRRDTRLTSVTLPRQSDIFFVNKQYFKHSTWSKSTNISKKNTKLLWMLPSSPAITDLLQFLLYLPFSGGRILSRNHPGGNSHQRTNKMGLIYLSDLKNVNNDAQWLTLWRAKSSAIKLARFPGVRQVSDCIFKVKCCCTVNNFVLMYC